MCMEDMGLLSYFRSFVSNNTFWIEQIDNKTDSFQTWQHYLQQNVVNHIIIILSWPFLPQWFFMNWTHLKQFDKVLSFLKGLHAIVWRWSYYTFIYWFQNICRSFRLTSSLLLYHKDTLWHTIFSICGRGQFAIWRINLVWIFGYILENFNL